MSKRFPLLLMAGLAVCLATSVAWAQSSGNFTAVGTSASCTATPATFNSATGSFTGSTLSGGTAITTFSANIKTSNGSGVALAIRPALVTGLFTETNLTTTINNATADVGIDVCVYVDPTVSGGNVTNSGLPVYPQNCVVYDQRIQQVSNTLFSNLATCVSTATTTTCSTDADCPSGDVCNAGICYAPATGCNFQLLLTTLSAHDFEFVAPQVGNGNHTVLVQWGEIGTNKSTTNGTTASCVGPAEITVTQVKNFSQDSGISISSN